MLHNRLATLFLLLLPVVLFAQTNTAKTTTRAPPRPHYWGPQFLSVLDSVDFARFKERCAGEDDTSPVAIFMDDHRMAWREQHHGGFWVVIRASGQSVKDFLAAEPEITRFPFGSGPASLGKRCAVVVRDEPTGIINRDVWYFEAP
ncbi:MAG: hypothetical protein IPM46_05595 [Flavobacteriales bacterium]|nr:hypothetical protein [Flavobacteriales bacterium]